MAWYETRAARALGVPYPIVQAPMVGVSTPELVAAVSNAGGIGGLGAAYHSPDELRKCGDPSADRPAVPRQPLRVAQDRAGRRRRARGRPRRASAGARGGRRRRSRAGRLGHAAALRGAADSAARGACADRELPLRRARPRAVRAGGHARRRHRDDAERGRTLEAAGVDLVCAQGWEAGGHRGTFERPAQEVAIGTLALVPQVVEAVSVPVLAAGGITDGRGIAAALALGAEGAWLGTAFIATPESCAHAAHKRALAGTALDRTTVSPAYSGRHARMLRSRLVGQLEASGREPLPFPVQLGVTRPVHAAALERGDLDHTFLLAGQAAGLARDLPAGELVAALIRESDAAVARLAALSSA